MKRSSVASGKSPQAVTHTDPSEKDGDIDDGELNIDKIRLKFGDPAMWLPDQRKESNKVRTTKYTWITWAPLSFFF